MDIKECIQQLEQRIDIMMEKKEKYLSKRLYALITPILLFLLGMTFTTIRFGYLIGISLGYGIVSSIYNFVRYQYYRGIILSDNMKKLEMGMLENADNLNEYFDSMRKKQEDIKKNIIDYSETLNLEIKVFLFCFLIVILNLSSKSIFFKMFGIAFSAGCLGDFLNIMDAFRQKQKHNDEYSAIGVFLEENNGIVEISNILSETIDFSNDCEQQKEEEYSIRNIIVDEDMNIIDMEILDFAEKDKDDFSLDSSDKNNTKVRKLTKNDNSRKK